MPAPVSMFQRFTLRLTVLPGSCPWTSRPQPLDRLAPGLMSCLARSKPEQRDINHRRVAVLQHCRGTRPDSVWRLGVHNADRAVRRFDRDRERQAGKGGAPPRVISGRDRAQPLGTRRWGRPRVRLQPAQHSTIVIANRDCIETPIEPLHCLVGMRTSVDEVSNAEEAIAPLLESERVKSTLKGPKTPVHIADNEVSTMRVCDERDTVTDRPAHAPVRRANSRWSARSHGARRSHITSPVLHDRDARVEALGAVIGSGTRGPDRMRETGLCDVERHVRLCSPGSERRPKSVRSSIDLQLSKELRESIVVELTPSLGHENEVRLRATLSSLCQIVVVARLAQYSKRRRRKRHTVLRPLFHSTLRYGPQGSGKIDLRPARTTRLVGPHSREDEELKKQTRANPIVGGASNARQGTRDLLVRQGSVMRDRRCAARQQGSEGRATRVIAAIARTDSPRQHRRDLLAKSRHRLGCPRTDSLQNGDHVRRFDITHAKSPKLRISVDFQRATPSALHLFGGPGRAPDPESPPRLPLRMSARGDPRASSRAGRPRHQRATGCATPRWRATLRLTSG